MQSIRTLTPALWRLNLPPELAQKFIALTLIAVVLIAGLGWLGLSQIRSASAPPTVKIGLVAPFEGLYRATGYEVLFAVRLAVQERNRAGGVADHRIELVALNDFNDPAEAEKQAQALVADPDVLGVVGHLEPAATLAALPVYARAKLAVSIPWSVSEAAFTGPGVVGVTATLEQTDARRAAIQAELGYAAAVEPISAGRDLTGLQADAVLLPPDPVSAGHLLNRLAETGLTPQKFGSVQAGNVQLVQVAGPNADGLIYPSAGPAASELTDQVQFVEAYRRLAGLPPGPRAIMAYDATNILLDSLEQAMIDRPREDIRSELRAKIRTTIPDIQRVGVSGPIAFDARGRRIDAPLWVYQISEANYPGIAVPLNEN